MTDVRYSGDPEEIARRLAAFESTRDPAVLWPGLTETARVAAARELERVTRLVLAGHTGVALDAARTIDDYAFGIAGHTTGMGPLIGRWLEDGLLTADVGAARMFAEHLDHARARAERMERGALPAIDALLARGITPVVLKGFHTGRAYFEEPGARRMTDIDLLVPADRVDDAETALAAAGFRPDGAPLEPYQREWIVDDADPRLFSIELTHARSKWTIEVHTSLDRFYYAGVVARLDPERSSVEQIDVAGRSLLVLLPALLLVYLACHCSQELNGVRLLRIVEMVRVIRDEQSRGRLDWNDVMKILRRNDAARFAYPSLALVNDLAPGSVDERVLALGRRASTWAARHTVARLTPAGGSLDDRGVLRQLMWTRGALPIARRLMRNVRPSTFERPGDVNPGWRVHLRRLSSGLLSFRAPDERK
jgi:hypothetical protein